MTGLPVVFIDMDGTLVDFMGYFEQFPEQRPVGKDLDDHEKVFELAEPMPDAITAVRALDPHFDLHILTKSPWQNSDAPSQKVAWIKQHFEDIASAHGNHHIFYKKVTISHNKHLLRGDYLIDDRAEQYPDFPGQLIHFGGLTAEGAPCTGDHPHPKSWAEVAKLLLPTA